MFTSCNNTQIYAQTDKEDPQNHASSYPIIPTGKGSEFTDQFMQIKLLGSIALNSVKINSLAVSELSGITWDKDEQLLYAISDEGLLYHLKLTIKEGHLKNLHISYATRLKNKKGKALKGKFSDSEGLSLVNGSNGKHGDSRLIIAFENKPRIVQYSPNGKFLGKLRLPKQLEKRKTFRHKNKALESVTIHPEYGVLTAAEYPVRKDNMKYQSLYSASGKTWRFAASKAANSAITGLETLANGDILVLERAYKNPLFPIVINLRRIKLDKCNKKKKCNTETIASFNGADGWLLDNFEGLAHFQGNQYLMISDDNDMPFQQTILILFEIDQPEKIAKKKI